MLPPPEAPRPSRASPFSSSGRGAALLLRSTPEVAAWWIDQPDFLTWIRKSSHGVVTYVCTSTVCNGLAKGRVGLNGVVAASRSVTRHDV